MLQLTKEELQVAQKEQLEKLIEHVGGISHLCKMLNMSYMVVTGWRKRGRISKEGAKCVEKHGTLKLKFKAKTLRPDL